METPNGDRSSGGELMSASLARRHRVLLALGSAVKLLTVTVTGAGISARQLVRLAQVPPVAKRLVSRDGMPESGGE